MLAGDQEGAISLSAGEARLGVDQAERIQIGAANRVNRIEMDANQGRLDAQMQAADITRNAGVKAADLRAMQRVLESLGGMISRDIQKNIEMRF